jgi:hypothetical protein
MLDLLIRNGLVIDGSGNPGYYATVGVEGDTIRILRGDTSALSAARTSTPPATSSRRASSTCTRTRA